MKILMINVVCGIKSTGRICTDLAEALEKQGHEVKIAYGRETVPEQYTRFAVKIGTNLDTKLHGLKARLFDGCGFGSKRATKQFVKWVEIFDPDIIHLHNLHGYYINIEVLFNYLRNSGKRIIWTLHDSWAFTEHSAYCDAVGCEKWKSGCNHCPLTHMYPKSYFDRSMENWRRKKRIMSGIPQVSLVTPSKWLRDLVKRSFLSEYQVTVIHNGIDTSKFYPIESNIKKSLKIDHKIMLLGVATTWNSMKGFNDYLQLAGILSEDYQIVLVGLTKKQKKHLPKNVIGLEQTTSINELAKLYSAADCFLNLSYCENYPTVNLEAMACWTPVITYQAGGSPESVQLWKGVVVEKGNIYAVKEAIIQNTSSAVHNDIKLDLKEIDKQRTLMEYLAII